MRRAAAVLAIVLASALYALAALFALLWVSGLEADYLSLGHVLGLDGPEPRVSTLAISWVAVLAAALILLIAARLRER